MMIRVIYNELMAGKVQDTHIDRLIRDHKIVGFFRSDGYVRVGNDPLRGSGGEYNGAERRRTTPG
ncbi:MAG: hypothetical protein PHR66_09780 [Desulfuromonadaceae bacterium]|nr:hypothetical protein [Desulfuromonadaceae bacterium]